MCTVSDHCGDPLLADRFGLALVPSEQIKQALCSERNPRPQEKPVLHSNYRTYDTQVFDSIHWQLLLFCLGTIIDLVTLTSGFGLAL